MKLVVLIPIILGMFSGCSPMESLKIPDPDTVTEIEGRLANSYDFDEKRYIGSISINDADKIRAVIKFLNGINTNMHGSGTTYPTPTHTIIIKDSGNINLVIFLGSNWIGGRNNLEGDSSANRLTQLSINDRVKFLKLLGFNSD